MISTNSFTEQTLYSTLQVDPLGRGPILPADVPVFPGTDDLNKNNYMWFWAGCANPHDGEPWNKDIRFEMRYIGYVFWDWIRVKDCGLVNEKYDCSSCKPQTYLLTLNTVLKLLQEAIRASS